jgi:hypothetical protein
MREQTGASVGAHSATDDVGSGALFIITLSSSTAPVALEVPSLPELIGLAVFRSRRVEDGRDRFRLHVGYFESTEAAELVLPAVRRHFPAAWVGRAPNSGMGSLDDTSVTQFKFIKAPNTISHETSGRFRAPLLEAPWSDGGTSTRLGPLASPPAAPTSPQRSAPPRAAKPASKPPASPARKISAPPLAPPAVLNLLESSAPSAKPVSRQAVMQPRERAAIIGAIQRFAVQLVWSTDPVDLASVPKLAIFDAYTLYKVQVDRAGRRWYGLRIGFFGDPVSARQVALYARSDFSAAAVVPVSDRECDRAGQAAISELPEAPAVPKVQDEMQLIDVPRTTQKSDLGATISDGKSLPASGPPAVLTGAKPQPAALAKTDTTRRVKSTPDLAADLQSDPEFDMHDSGDPMNDTGVRHLALKVIKKKSKPSKLFGRGSRRADH